MNITDTIPANAMENRQQGPYGYQPALELAITFTCLFGVFAVIFTIQALYRRSLWFFCTMAIGCWLESAGHGIRIFGHFHPRVLATYVAQESVLQLTPSLLAVSQFIILARLYKIYGQSMMSTLAADRLLAVFISIGFLALLTQGIGGGSAILAQSQGASTLASNKYAIIVVSGLALQLAGFLLYGLLLFHFFSRTIDQTVTGELPMAWFTRRFSFFLTAMTASALLIVGRDVFRLVAMLKGWRSFLSRVEWHFYVLDATFIALAMFVLLLVSPLDYVCKEREVRLTAVDESEEKRRVDDGSYLEAQKNVSRFSEYGTDREPASLSPLHSFDANSTFYRHKNANVEFEYLHEHF